MTKITMTAAGLQVPDDPILPFIEGDGTGPRHLGRVGARVRRRGGEGLRRQAQDRVDGGARGREGLREAPASGCPTRRSQAFKDYLVGIKGPLTTPVGGGIRSLNVALRQMLDLYVCLRPVQYFTGVPSPVKQPELTNMVIFRENTEDIYAGIEFQAGRPRTARSSSELFQEHFPDRFEKIRFPETSGIGIKPVSREGTDRLVRAAIEYAIARRPRERHARPQGEHHEVHRGRVPRLGLRSSPRTNSAAKDLDGGPWQVIEQGRARSCIVKDVIADAFLQQILTRPGGVRA